MLPQISRSWQSQCLFAVLCTSVLVSSLNAFSFRHEHLDDYSDHEDPCEIICMLGNLSQCVECSNVHRENLRSGSMDFQPRSTSNNGCGCCAHSRNPNSFCCQTCHGRNRQG
ncbi:hypothetical protein EGW08_013352 [Elysia chlorotica]|uniref:Laminin EGF-like domain-containing protein n=1 Tax=Elysia chlorotica TaxID=188477 RepID=A0A3S1HGF3_ELYCH|nr:hypothetical protein EGW08_013352 [Elysia chlorotica]